MRLLCQDAGPFDDFIVGNFYDAEWSNDPPGWRVVDENGISHVFFSIASCFVPVFPDKMDGLIWRQVYRAMNSLGASPELLSIIGSRYDTLSDEEVLEELRDYNTGGALRAADEHLN